MLRSLSFCVLALANFHHFSSGFTDQTQISTISTAPTVLASKLIHFTYRFHRQPKWSDWGVGLDYSFDLSSGTFDNLLALQLQYFYEQREFYRLHHYFFKAGLEGPQFKILSQFDLSHTHITKFVYEKDIENWIIFKTGRIHWGYSHLISWLPNFQLLHGGVLTVILGRANEFLNELDQIGIYFRQSEHDYHFLAFYQFSIPDFFSDRLDWIVKLSYEINPGRLTFALTTRTDFFELDTATTYQPGWGFKPQISIGIPQFSFDRNSQVVLPKVDHSDFPIPKNFYIWWTSITFEDLSEIISRSDGDGLQDSKIWLKAVWEKRNKIKKLNDLITVGLKDLNVNYYYYQIIKKELMK